MKQRTPEWYDFRRGKITASRFGDVLADPKTKRYREYLEEVVDGLTGVPRFEDDKPWFRHGVENEDAARGMYEWKTDTEVELVGSVVHPEYDFISCSPDGQTSLCGIEIKCRSSFKSHVSSIKKGILSSDIPQVQGCLWITGLDYWEYISYYKNPHILESPSINIHAVLPDEEYHERLEAACISFWEEVQNEKS